MNEMHEIGKRIRTQDNRITEHPLFLVQQKRRIYGFDPDYCDNRVWIDSCNDYDEADEADAAKLDSGEMSDECWTLTAYEDRWEFVTAFFTEAGAESYLRANRHNLTEPRIYAASLHRNAEMIAVRNHLVATSNRQDEHDAALDLHAARAVTIHPGQ
jgi:hypothetical protein